MNHWYISLSYFYPKGKTRQATLSRKYSLIECFNEAEPQEIDRYGLIYLGFGFFDCEHIQKNYRTYQRRIENGNR